MAFKKMAFKWSATIICCTVFLSSMISCTKQEGRTEPSGKNENDSSAYTDSIVFNTSNKEFIYLGQRLYPSSNSDSSSKHSVRPDILSIERVGDTVFVFLNNDMLYDQENIHLPPISDSLVRHHYPKYYEVEIEDDLPYMIYLTSSKDSIHFVKDRKNVFYWDAAIIRDTVLSVFGGVKVGMKADKVLDGLVLPLDIFERFQGKDFFLILCHGSVPYKIWFTEKFGEKLATEKSTIQMLFRFEKGQLKDIRIDPWIVYGAKDDSL